MYRLFLLLLLGVVTSTAALSDVHQRCISDNNEPLDNDLLIGTWYMMYKFTLFGGFVPTESCPVQAFTKPDAEKLAEYKEKYNDPDLPYSLDDNPILRDDHVNWQGLITGNNQAKFFIIDPNNHGITISGGYSVVAFRFLGNDYIMWQDCAMRGNIRELYSRNRYAPVAEMQELIKNTPELARLSAQRWCATY